MSCSLLHIMEEPDVRPYADAAVKDVVGDLPRFLCAKCTPLKPLPPSEALKCLDRDDPCWKPDDEICD